MDTEIINYVLPKGTKDLIRKKYNLGVRDLTKFMQKQALKLIK